MTVQDTLWIEKHRPETLDDIIGHEDEVDRLERYAGDNETPHMIFAGPAGTGKTATIVAFAKEVYGDNWSANLTEMNASDERGIDVVRNKIKGIARSNPAGDADFQILFLDEADQLTRDAQASLRRIMEQHSDVTRFFLSCNYPNQIIEAIQSRCSIFRFGRLTDEEIRQVVMRVIEAEDLEYDDDAVDAIVRDSRGDARSAVNSLQSSAVDGEITADTVETVVGVIDDDLVEQLVQMSIEGEVDDAMEILDRKLIKQGADVQNLTDSFLRVIKRMDIPAPGKQICVDKLADCEWRVMRGSNPNVQFHSLLCDINVGYHTTYGSYDNEGES